MSTLLATALALAISGPHPAAQVLPPSANGPAASAPAALPDAPVPAVDLTTSSDSPSAQQQQQSQPATPAPAQPGTGSSSSNGSTSSNDPGQSSPSSQSSSQPPPGQQTQHDKAQQQVQEEEHQRILGIAPAFNTSYRKDAVSLTAGQKIDLAFHSSIDPFTFAASFLVAGYHEALDDDPGFGWGAEGYFKRSGAAYLDAFDGDMIGNGFLPALLHQDPRYFRLGHGTKTHRILYALATNVICKHDNTGKWEPNYSNVGGNIIAGAISNLYYPSQNEGLGQTISNGMIVTAEGGLGSLFQEFWPDISRKVLHRDPTHGLDAQAAAQDAQKKQQQQSSGAILK
jgi:hypothetical protein